MGGRNNKLCDQKGQDPKGVRQEKKLTKRNPAVGQKDHFKCIWPAKKNKNQNSSTKILKEWCASYKNLLNFRHDRQISSLIY